MLSIPPIFPLNKNHAYALAGSWCWIRGDDEYDSIVRIVSQYAAQILCGVYIVYIYWHFLRKLFISTSSISEVRARLMNETIGRLKWFPIVYIICYIPGIVNRFSEIFITFNDQDAYVLTFVHFGALSVSGFLNALIYSWTKPVKQVYKQICFTWNQGRPRNSLNVNWALYSELDETTTNNVDSTHSINSPKKTAGASTAILVSGITTAPNSTTDDCTQDAR